LDAAGGAAEMSALPQAVVPMLGKLVPRLSRITLAKSLQQPRRSPAFSQQINWIGTI
jgi:hypothetical protein